MRWDLLIDFREKGEIYIRTIQKGSVLPYVIFLAQKYSNCYVFGSEIPSNYQNSSKTPFLLTDAPKQGKMGQFFPWTIWYSAILLVISVIENKIEIASMKYDHHMNVS